jgi:CubicO group peptidase (beta-lactamase class C family)
VLAKRSVEEMRTVQTLSDHVRWAQGYGLGLQLFRDGERVLAGHGGSMPGFIAGMMVSPADRIGAAVLTNSSTARVGKLALQLVSETVDRWPAAPEPWQVGDPPPDDVAPLLGIWFMEGDEIVFRWRNGTLEAQFADAEPWEEPAVFERGGDGRWRIASGWEHGEVLRVEEDRMVLSGYPVTRAPQVWV